MIFRILFTPKFWVVSCLEERNLVNKSYIISVNLISRYICLKIPSEFRQSQFQMPVGTLLWLSEDCSSVDDLGYCVPSTWNSVVFSVNHSLVHKVYSTAFVCRSVPVLCYPQTFLLS